jgi:hypothetical protein
MIDTTEIKNRDIQSNTKSTGILTELIESASHSKTTSCVAKSCKLSISLHTVETNKTPASLKDTK